MKAVTLGTLITFGASGQAALFGIENLLVYFTTLTALERGSSIQWAQVRCRCQWDTTSPRFIRNRGPKKIRIVCLHYAVLPLNYSRVERQLLEREAGVEHCTIGFESKRYKC
jgi:hypothetical protein